MIIRFCQRVWLSFVKICEKQLKWIIHLPVNYWTSLNPFLCEFEWTPQLEMGYAYNRRVRLFKRIKCQHSKWNRGKPFTWTYNMKSKRLRKIQLHEFAIYFYLCLCLYRVIWPSAVFECDIWKTICLLFCYAGKTRFTN